MSIQETRRDSLRRIIAERFGGNVSRFAQSARKAQSQIADMLDGRKAFGERVARAIESNLHLPVGYLDLGYDLAVAEVQGDHRLTIKASRVPIIGTAQLAADGSWQGLGHSAGAGDGYLDVPSADQNAYAVKVTGDSMFPRIRSGEYVLCEPNHPYGPGDEVLVETADGRTMVREFLYARDGIVTLHSVNDGQGRLTLRTDEITKIHFVAAIVKYSRWRESV